MSGELLPERRDMRTSHEDREEVMERLRVAAGDGRLTAEELDERLESAFHARTYGELERIVADLPAQGSTSAVPAQPVVPAKEVVRLASRNGNITRGGPWSVPRRLDVESRNGNVTIDLTRAEISHSTLDLAIRSHNGNLTLIVTPAISVDVDDVTLRNGSTRMRVHPDPGTPRRLHVTISGRLRNGNVVIRGPRRSFWDWLLGRRPQLPPA